MEFCFVRPNRDRAPINPRNALNPIGPIRPIYSRKRKAHQAKAPPSEFKVCKSSDFENSGAPHQSKALFPEFKACKSSD